MSAPHHADVVIVGSGHAGVQLAASLRESGYSGTITLFNGEPHAPYYRPSLSKEILAAAPRPVDLALRSDTFYTSRELRLEHTQVSRIDRERCVVGTVDGREWRYSYLVLATGGRPRPLSVSGADLDGVVMLRSLDEAQQLRARLDAARSVVVIGGGFIGLEVAAAASERGLSVDVIEAADRLMSRIVTPPVSAAAAQHHQAHGVRLHLGDQVREIRGSQGAVTEVVTSSGAEIPADLVVVGVGMMACDDLARHAGLSCDRGVLVDNQLRTADPRIFAIGDCAVICDHTGARHRLESVQSATDQARYVAAQIMGAATGPYSAVPWFWSTQGSLKLQMVGRSTQCTDTVVRGGESRFSVFCFRENTLIGVESVNDPGTHMVTRRLFERGLTLHAATLEDENFDLRRIAKRLLAGPEAAA